MDLGAVVDEGPSREEAVRWFGPPGSRMNESTIASALRIEMSTMPPAPPLVSATAIGTLKLVMAWRRRSLVPRLTMA